MELPPRILVKTGGGVPGRRLPRDILGSPEITDTVKERLRVDKHPIATPAAVTDGLAFDAGREQRLQRLVAECATMPELQARQTLMQSALYEEIPDQFIRSIFLKRALAFWSSANPGASGKPRVIVKAQRPDACDDARIFIKRG
jgi:hypothetical protein